MTVDEINQLIDDNPGSTFDVTGVDVYGRRFKKSYSNVNWAWGINLYRGSVWIVFPSGKRKKIRSVYN